jgi:hypothetical protein
VLAPTKNNTTCFLKQCAMIVIIVITLGILIKKLHGPFYHRGNAGNIINNCLLYGTVQEYIMVSLV